MLYEQERELADLSIQKWTSDEVYSFGWFIMLGVLIVEYKCRRSLYNEY